MPLLRPRSRRALAAVTALAAGVLAAPVVAPAAAQAADPEPFLVVGTSDVFDSFLTQTVLEPSFERDFPQYDFQYTARGTGAALNLAKTGAFDAAIVHAAAIENQFVADGYSTERYGRAVFWGDFVLLGPAADPAGVLANAPQDIVTAFERIAAAGANGDADFVSRGGTPGTSVQEHAIWALSQGTDLCTVPASNGGGKQPSTSTGTCNSDFQQIPLPAWYHQSYQQQGDNVKNGDACTTASYVSEACYVFTDRGTFDYLDQSGALRPTDDPRRLRVVTRGSNVPGEENLLINSFHAYGVNPAKFADNPDVQAGINSAAANTFLAWIASPKIQAEIGAYLNGKNDAPFKPSAAPSISTNPLPSVLPAGRVLQIPGSIKNVVPGTPALDGVPVKLLARPIGRPDVLTQVATATTDANGRFVLSYKPTRGMAYTVATDAITKIEVPTLTPVFGDLLAPSQKTLGQVPVRGSVTGVQVKRKKGFKVGLKGTIAPAVVGGAGKVQLYAARPGKALKLKGQRGLRAGATKFDQTFKLGKGRWRIEVRYVNPGVVLTAVSGRKTVKLVK